VRGRLGAAFAIAAGAVVIFPARGEVYLAMHHPPGEGLNAHVEEGLDTVVATFERDEFVRNYIGGLQHGGRPGFMFRAMAMEAVRWAPRVDRVLLIGFGTGTTMEVVQQLPTVDEIVLVELSDTLLANLRKIPLFDPILSDTRLETVIDDGRRYLLRNPAPFDLILMDPIRTTTAYSNNLYSRQFFSLASDRLGEDGVMMVWTDDMQGVPRTLTEVFPHLRCYVTLCIASNAAMSENTALFDEIGGELGDRWRRNAKRVEKGYIGDREVMRERTKTARVNEDWRPNSEYYLGRSR
jgi:spermidine synthase